MLPVDAGSGRSYAGRVSPSDPCQAAEELAELHRAELINLREARRRLADLTHELETSLPLRDRGQLEAAKEHAREEYRRALAEARDQAAVQQAATRWMDEVNRLNRAALLAQADDGRQGAEYSRLETAIRRLEVEVDARRIRAEAAREQCNEARRATAIAAELEDARHGSVGRLAPAGGHHQPTVSGLLRGDRAVLEQVAARLAAETDRDADRLQLLLIELCEQIASCALGAGAISFAADHPFWTQFEPTEAQRLAVTLAQLGYRYDGHSGWLDGRVPGQRHIPIALAHAGLDSRILRPLSQADIDDLWRGAALESVQHLARAAPDLSLDQVQAMLATRGNMLDELWDIWPNVRRALLG
jgi:hypothetical protein